MRHLLALLLLALPLRAAIPPPSTWDWEAARWQFQVATNGGTLSSTAYRAGTKFMLQVKDWGLRPRLGRVNLYLGTDTNAMLVPIIRDWFTTANIVDNLLNFVSTDWSEASGLTGNTTTKSLRPNGNNFVAVNTFTDGNSIHYAVYVQTASSEQSIEMGSSGGAQGAYYINVSYSDVTYLQMGTIFASVADTQGTGFYVNCRSSSTRAVCFKNGAVIITDTNTDAGTLFGNPIVHALNTLGAENAWTSRTLSGYFMGFSLTDAQQVPYYKAVQNVQIAMRRAK